MIIDNDVLETTALPDLMEVVDVGLMARVTLFNDENHFFEEVTEQIIKATGCTYSKAEVLTNAVHSFGKAVVFEGTLPLCIRVSGVLEEIDLATQVDC